MSLSKRYIYVCFVCLYFMCMFHTDLTIHFNLLRAKWPCITEDGFSLLAMLMGAHKVPQIFYPP